MDDDLDQLLENLKLRRLKHILPRELERAERHSPSYSDFLARLLREVCRLASFRRREVED